MWNYSILYQTDPNTFASLLVVHRNWRRAAQSPQLFAHHLSRCPSYSASNNVIAGILTDSDLPRLRKRFQVEAKRNLFDIYVRPRKTVIKLISTSASSSAAFPGGEAFHFSISQNGHWVLALSSSRIYIIDAASSLVSVKRELKILRRALSAAIVDDGSILAVLFTDQEVNLYDLTGIKAKHLRSVPLDNPPRTIALSPTATVLAAAYDRGIEVYSLASDASSTDRRAVKCDSVDSLSFSPDGTVLLGTTLSFQNPNTVLLSAPYLTEGAQGENDTDLLSQMWTTQILFPNSSHNETHSTLLPCPNEGDSSWMFLYDRPSANFRAIKVEDFERSATPAKGPDKKLLPPRRKYLPSTLPAVSGRGEAVAVGFASNDIYLYGVPETLNAGPDLDQMDTYSVGSTANVPTDLLSSNETATASSQVSLPATNGVDSSSSGSHRRQKSLEKSRYVFDHRRRIGIVDGLSALRWVSRGEVIRKHDLCGERLVAVAPGGVSYAVQSEDEEAVPVDGGRIIIFDFDFGAQGTGRASVTIELGENVPELLEERTRNIETEVDIVRRRTIAQRRGGVRDSRRITLIDAASAMGASSSLNEYNAVFAARPGLEVHSTSLPTTPNLPEPARPSQATFSPLEDNFTLEEAQQAFDDPYSHTQPRSSSSLFRAATAVAANRQLNASRLRVPSSGHVEYRRPGGRGELPHESDADNWVPPPPPYTPDPDAPLPEHLQLTLLPRSTEPTTRVTSPPQQPIRAQTTLESLTQSALQRTRSRMERPTTWLRARRPSTRGIDSDTEIVTSGTLQAVEPTYRTQQSQQPSSSQQPLHLPEPERRPITSPIGATIGNSRHAVSAPTSPIGDPNPWQPLPTTFEYPTNSPHSMRARITSPISPIPQRGFNRDTLGSPSSGSSPSFSNISPPDQSARIAYFPPTSAPTATFAERLDSQSHPNISPPDQDVPTNHTLSSTTPSNASSHQYTGSTTVNTNSPDTFVSRAELPPSAPTSFHLERLRGPDSQNINRSEHNRSTNYLSQTVAPTHRYSHHPTDSNHESHSSHQQNISSAHIHQPTNSTPSFAERLNFPVPPPPSDDLFSSTSSPRPNDHRNVSSPPELTDHNRTPPSSTQQQIIPPSLLNPHPARTSSIPQPGPVIQQRNVSSPPIFPYSAPMASSPQSIASSLPQIVPSSHLSEPVAASSPTAEQLSNLQNRYNRPGASTIRRRPVANAQNSLGYPVPIAPRAAAGRRSTSVNTLAPVPPSSSISRSNSRGNSRSASNPIGRSNSRGSARSASSSTPNLHRPPAPVPLNRLETIQSVVSARRMSRTPPTSPPRSRSRGDVSSVGTVLPKRHPSRAERSAAINLKEAKRRGWGSGGKKKKRKGGSVWGGSSEWTDETGGSNDGEDKSGGRCVVM